MKRLHVSVSVTDVDEPIRFYSAFFAAAPAVEKGDYAKWMLDDPRVNFSIFARGRAAGVDHLGIQVEDGEELAEVYGRMKAAEGPVREVGETTCCYALTEKSWIADPQGVNWETFLTTGVSTVYGRDDEPGAEVPAGAAKCCAGTPSAA